MDPLNNETKVHGFSAAQLFKKMQKAWPSRSSASESLKQAKEATCKFMSDVVWKTVVKHAGKLDTKMSKYKSYVKTKKGMHDAYEKVEPHLAKGYGRTQEFFESGKRKSEELLGKATKTAGLAKKTKTSDENKLALMTTYLTQYTKDIKAYEDENILRTNGLLRNSPSITPKECEKKQKDFMAGKGYPETQDPYIGGTILKGLLTQHMPKSFIDKMRSMQLHEIDPNLKPIQRGKQMLARMENVNFTTEEKQFLKALIEMYNAAYEASWSKIEANKGGNAAKKMDPMLRAFELDLIIDLKPLEEQARLNPALVLTIDSELGKSRDVMSFIIRNRKNFNKALA